MKIILQKAAGLLTAGALLTGVLFLPAQSLAGDSLLTLATASAGAVDALPENNEANRFASSSAGTSLQDAFDGDEQVPRAEDGATTTTTGFSTTTGVSVTTTTGFSTTTGFTTTAFPGETASSQTTAWIPGTTDTTEVTSETGTTYTTEVTPETGITRGTEVTPETGITRGTEVTPETGITRGTQTTPETGTTMGTQTTPETGTTMGTQTTPETGTTMGTQTTPETGTTPATTTATMPITSTAATTAPVTEEEPVITSTIIGSAAQVTKLVVPQENGTSDVYFLYGVGSLHYRSTGYTLQCGDKQAAWETDTVYQSVQIDGTTYTAAQFGAKYLVALRLSGVPDAMTGQTTATPFQSKTSALPADAPKQKPTTDTETGKENA